MTPFQLSFRAARRVSTPIAHVKTPDQAMTLEAIKTAVTNGSTPPVLVWDAVRGCQWGNEQGLEVCWKGILGRKTEPVPKNAGDLEAAKKELAQATADLVDALLAVDTPAVEDGSVIVVMNAHLWWEKPHVVQAICNLRDSFKRDAKILVLLTTQSASLPTELRDALPLAEELPSLEELEHIVTENMELADLGEKESAKKAKRAPATVEMSAEAKTAAVDAVCGLAAFPAEQSVAMSFVKDSGGKIITLDTEALWNRKVEEIERTRGLSVWRGKDGFSAMGGVEQAKKFGRNIIGGRKQYRTYILIDELEKAVAGADNSENLEGGGGPMAQMVGGLLTEMANREYDGMIAVGPAGTGKTQFAKSLAGEAGRPLIILDFAGIQEKWVGSSNENLNSVFAVIKAISQGSAFWIGSCNSTGNLSPALKRRFNKGTFFFDLPSDEEKVPIWDIYLKRYEINPKQKRPNDAGWTAADIKQACETSWSFGISLIEASEYLTPVAHTDARRIEQLRRAAQSAGYLSASHPGRYVFARQDEPEDKAAPKKARTIRVEEQQ